MLSVYFLSGLFLIGLYIVRISKPKHCRFSQSALIVGFRDDLEPGSWLQAKCCAPLL